MALIGLKYKEKYPKFGVAYSWGWNYYGELGESPFTQNYTNFFLTNHSSFTEEAINLAYLRAVIKANGTLWTWGTGYGNKYGSCGKSDIINHYSPVQVGALTNWSKIANSEYAIKAIKTDGTLWTWGYNGEGQLGLGDVIHRSSPTQVGNGTTWSKISGCVAIKTDGTLWAWGNNAYGQLGLRDTINRSSPVQVGALTNWSDVVSQYDGQNIIAIKTDGTLWTWGRNIFGQLGLGDKVNRSSPTQVGALTNWSKIYYFNSAYAIKTDGTLWAWGNNSAGQLGIGNGENKSSPTQVGALTTWSKMTKSPTSTTTSLAIKTDGTLWQWGNWETSSPVQIGSATDWSFVNVGDGYQFAVKNNGDVYAKGSDINNAITSNEHYVNPENPTFMDESNGWDISGSYSNGSAASIIIRRIDKTLWVCGRNNYGQLGTGDLLNKSVLTQIGSSNKWNKAYLSSLCSFFVDVNGVLWGSGDNTYGGLGLGDEISRSSITQIGSSTNWKHLSPGAHSLLVKTDGTLWSCGGSSGFFRYGQLGLGDTENRSSPVQVGALTNWDYAISASYSSYAIKTNGTLWSWGNNASGQLGLNDTNSRSSPVQVGALTNWASIASSGNSAIAVKTDGTLWAWGQNTYGQLGLNDTINRSSPTQVGSGTNWSKAVLSLYATYLLKTDGTLWACGYGDAGYLYPSNDIWAGKSSPVQIGTYSNWIDFYSGSSFMVGFTNKYI